MAYDDTTPLERSLAELSADLPSATVYRFPDAFVMRPPPGSRGDQVAVTHAGRTTIYPCPQALAAAVRAADPQLAAERAEVARLQGEALGFHRAAKAARDAAEQRLEAIGLAAVLAAGCAALIALAVIL